MRMQHNHNYLCVRLGSAVSLGNRKNRHEGRPGPKPKRRVVINHQNVNIYRHRRRRRRRPLMTVYLLRIIPRYIILYHSIKSDTRSLILGTRARFHIILLSL